MGIIDGVTGLGMGEGRAAMEGAQAASRGISQRRIILEPFFVWRDMGIAILSSSVR